MTQMLNFKQQIHGIDMKFKELKKEKHEFDEAMQCLKQNIERGNCSVQELEDAKIMNKNIIKNLNAQLQDTHMVQCK